MTYVQNFVHFSSEISYENEEDIQLILTKFAPKLGNHNMNFKTNLSP